MSEFTTITFDEERITSPMPPADSVVEVLLTDGRIILAWFDSSTMDAGDYDFLPLKGREPDMEADSIAKQVVAWRPQ